MSFRQHITKTIYISIPLVIGQLGQLLMGLVDTIMVGKIGAAPLAASALGNGLYFIVLIFGFGLAMALSPMISEYAAKGETELCGLIQKHSLLINMLTAIIITVITFFAADLIVYFKQTKEVETLAISYSKILALSTIAHIYFQTFRNFADGLSILKPAMYIAIFANFVNAFLNWVFIYGRLGFPEMGLDGAGWATLGSRSLMAIAIFVYIMSADRFKKYHPGVRFKGIRWDYIKRLLKVGIGSGFQYVFEAGVFVTAAFIVGWLGTNELAAHQITINLASATYTIAVGVSMGAAIRVGAGVGLKNTQEIRLAGFSAFVTIAGIMSINALIFLVFRDLLPTFYIGNPEVVAISSQLLVIAAVFQISDGIQAVGLGALRGLSDVKMPTIITFISYWIIGLPVGYYFGFILKLDVMGIWYGLSTGLTASAVLLLWRFNILSKRVASHHPH
ncbi:MAG: MATE family efflux transporter [Calditrichaeota bacterium]|nr:MATE family efflux transporter [Calditrichota bacterium]